MENRSLGGAGARPQGQDHAQARGGPSAVSSGRSKNLVRSPKPQSKFKSAALDMIPSSELEALREASLLSAWNVISVQRDSARSVGSELPSDSSRVAPPPQPSHRRQVRPSASQLSFLSTARPVPLGPKFEEEIVSQRIELKHREHSLHEPVSVAETSKDAFDELEQQLKNLEEQQQQSIPAYSRNGPEKAASRSSSQQRVTLNCEPMSGRIMTARAAAELPYAEREVRVRQQLSTYHPSVRLVTDDPEGDSTRQEIVDTSHPVRVPVKYAYANLRFHQGSPGSGGETSSARGERPQIDGLSKLLGTLSQSRSSPSILTRDPDAVVSVSTRQIDQMLSSHPLAKPNKSIKTSVNMSSGSSSGLSPLPSFPEFQASAETLLKEVREQMTRQKAQTETAHSSRSLVMDVVKPDYDIAKTLDLSVSFPLLSRHVAARHIPEDVIGLRSEEANDTDETVTEGASRQLHIVENAVPASLDTATELAQTLRDGLEANTAFVSGLLRAASETDQSIAYRTLTASVRTAPSIDPPQPQSARVSSVNMDGANHELKAHRGRVKPHRSALAALESAFAKIDADSLQLQTSEHCGKVEAVETNSLHEISSQKTSMQTRVNPLPPQIHCVSDSAVKAPTHGETSTLTALQVLRTIDPGQKEYASLRAKRVQNPQPGGKSALRPKPPLADTIEWNLHTQWAKINPGQVKSIIDAIESIRARKPKSSKGGLPGATKLRELMKCLHPRSRSGDRQTGPSVASVAVEASLPDTARANAVKRLVDATADSTQLMRIRTGAADPHALSAPTISELTNEDNRLAMLLPYPKTAAMSTDKQLGERTIPSPNVALALTSEPSTYDFNYIPVKRRIAEESGKYRSFAVFAEAFLVELVAISKLTPRRSKLHTASHEPNGDESDEEDDEQEEEFDESMPSTLVAQKDKSSLLLNMSTAERAETVVVLLQGAVAEAVSLMQDEELSNTAVSLALRWIEQRRGGTCGDRTTLSAVVETNLPSNSPLKSVIQDFDARLASRIQIWMVNSPSAVDPSAMHSLAMDTASATLSNLGELHSDLSLTPADVLREYVAVMSLRLIADVRTLLFSRDFYEFGGLSEDTLRKDIESRIYEIYNEVSEDEQRRAAERAKRMLEQAMDAAQQQLGAIATTLRLKMDERFELPGVFHVKRLTQAREEPSTSPDLLEDLTVGDDVFRDKSEDADGKTERSRQDERKSVHDSHLQALNVSRTDTQTVPQTEMGPSSQETWPLVQVGPQMSSSVSTAIIYTPKPYFDLAQDLYSDTIRLIDLSKQLRAAIRSKTAELAELEQEARWVAAWHAKKELQLGLYQRGERGVKAELELIEHVQEDTWAELIALDQENKRLASGLKLPGLAIGGDREHEYYVDLVEKQEHSQRLGELELMIKDQATARAQVAVELKLVHLDRAKLLTRIETLEQAVSIMHHHVAAVETEQFSDSEDEDFAAPASQQPSAQPLQLTQQETHSNTIRTRKADELDGDELQLTELEEPADLHPLSPPSTADSGLGRNTSVNSLAVTPFTRVGALSLTSPGAHNLSVPDSERRDHFATDRVPSVSNHMSLLQSHINPEAALSLLPQGISRMASHGPSYQSILPLKPRKGEKSMSWLYGALAAADHADAEDHPSDYPQNENQPPTSTRAKKTTSDTHSNPNRVTGPLTTRNRRLSSVLRMEPSPADLAALGSDLQSPVEYAARKVVIPTGALSSLRNQRSTVDGSYCYERICDRLLDVDCKFDNQPDPSVDIERLQAELAAARSLLEDSMSARSRVPKRGRRARPPASGAAARETAPVLTKTQPLGASSHIDARSTIGSSHKLGTVALTENPSAAIALSALPSAPILLETVVSTGALPESSTTVVPPEMQDSSSRKTDTIEFSQQLALAVSVGKPLCKAIGFSDQIAENISPDAVLKAMEAVVQAGRRGRRRGLEFLEEGLPYISKEQLRPDDHPGLRSGPGYRIPPFLEYDGWVRDSKMRKIDAEVRVKEIWSLKALADQRAAHVSARPTSLHKFFEAYCRSRTGNNPVRAVWFGTNLIVAMQRDSTDPDFRVFLSVLFEMCSEQVQYDQTHMVHDLRDTLFALEASPENRALVSLRPHLLQARSFEDVAQVDEFGQASSADGPFGDSQPSVGSKSDIADGVDAPKLESGHQVAVSSLSAQVSEMQQPLRATQLTTAIGDLSLTLLNSAHLDESTTETADNNGSDDEGWGRVAEVGGSHLEDLDGNRVGSPMPEIPISPAASPSPSPSPLSVRASPINDIGNASEQPSMSPVSVHGGTSTASIQSGLAEGSRFGADEPLSARSQHDNSGKDEVKNINQDLTPEAGSVERAAFEAEGMGGDPEVVRLLGARMQRVQSRELSGSENIERRDSLTDPEESAKLTTSILNVVARIRRYKGSPAPMQVVHRVDRTGANISGPSHGPAKDSKAGQTHGVTIFSISDEIRTQSWLHKDLLAAALRVLFPTKSETRLLELLTVVHRDAVKQDFVALEQLLNYEDPDGYQSNFMELVRDQDLEELFEYVYGDLREALYLRALESFVNENPDEDDDLEEDDDGVPPDESLDDVLPFIRRAKQKQARRLAKEGAAALQAMRHVVAEETSEASTASNILESVHPSKKRKKRFVKNAFLMLRKNHNDASKDEGDDSEGVSSPSAQEEGKSASSPTAAKAGSRKSKSKRRRRAENQDLVLLGDSDALVSPKSGEAQVLMPFGFATRRASTHDAFGMHIPTPGQILRPAKRGNNVYVRRSLDARLADLPRLPDFDDPDGPWISVKDIVLGILDTDPDKPAQEVFDYIVRGTGNPHVVCSSLVRIELFLNVLILVPGTIRRTGPKPAPLPMSVASALDAPSEDSDSVDEDAMSDSDEDEAGESDLDLEGGTNVGSGPNSPSLSIGRLGSTMHSVAEVDVEDDDAVEA